MKKDKLLKLNIYSILFIFILVKVVFAASTIYSPGSTQSIYEGPLGSQGAFPSDSVISAKQAEIISQIEVRDPSLVEFMGPDKGVKFTDAVIPSINPTPNFNLTPTSLQIMTVQSEKAPSISAPAYILINATTGHIYAKKDENKKYEPAGLVNLMTAFIATQKLAMNSILNVNNSAIKGIDKDAAIAALNNGDAITLKDAIASMFVKGCVDSANVIAENVSGSIEEFVTLMNQTSKSLGMSATFYIDPSGINNNNTASATDIAILMAYVCNNNELKELLKLSTYTLPPAKKRDKLVLYSKNSHLTEGAATHNPNVTASRLGYNSKSKYCIASLMDYNNQQIIAVVLKASGTQFSDTKKLLEYAKIAVAEER